MLQPPLPITERSWKVQGFHAFAKASIDAAICVRLRLNPHKLELSAIIGIVDLVNVVRDSRSKWAQPRHWLQLLHALLELPATLLIRLGLGHANQLLQTVLFGDCRTHEGPR